MNTLRVLCSFFVTVVLVCQPRVQAQELTPLLTRKDAAQFAGLVVAYHHYPYEHTAPFKPLLGPLGEPLSVGWLTNKPLTWSLYLDAPKCEGYGLKKLKSTQLLHQPSTLLDLTDYYLKNHRIEIRRLTHEEEKMIIRLIAHGKACFNQDQ